MLSQTVSIVFAIGFLSVVCGLEAEQRAAYEAAFKCHKAGRRANTQSLKKEGSNPTSKEMIASGCLWGKVSFDFKGLAICDRS